MQAQKPDEYQVKAAYLHGFGQFVTWPDAAGGRAVFEVCLLGRDPFGDALNEVVAGAVVRDKPVTVRRLTRAREVAGGCHILFVSVPGVELGAVLDFVRGLPVLTVGESPQFAERGGIIGFVTQSNRVRFVVNRAAADRAGLSLSSELLRVASAVLQHH